MTENNTPIEVLVLVFKVFLRNFINMSRVREPDTQQKAKSNIKPKLIANANSSVFKWHLFPTAL